MAHTEVRVRIAPSPTGDWHLGNARTALFTYLYARHHGGKFYLRIEDTDRTRLVEGAVGRLLGLLAWLGMTPDTLPDGKPYFVQSQNLHRYKEVVDQLLESGHAYYCFATSEELEAMRKDQEAAKQPPRYDNRWGYRDLPLAKAQSRIAQGEKAVVRLKMPLEGDIVVHDTIRGAVTFQASTLDDHVILKSDGFPTYHLAHAVDDRDMGITLVSRGEEWLSSAPRHVVLHQALGWNVPEYAHVPIILGPDKGKLSKRHGAKPVYEYEKDGYLADALVNYLALLGWSSGDDQVIFSRDELIQKFSLERVQASPAVFDAAKLDWFNGQYIRNLVCSSDAPASQNTLRPDLDVSVLRDTLLRYANSPEVGVTTWQTWYEQNNEKFDNIVVAMYERMTRLPDFDPKVYYAGPDEYNFALLPAKAQSLKESGNVLKRVSEALESVNNWTYEGLKNTLDELVEALGIKVGHLYLPLRYVLTGRAASVGALECLVILGKDESVARVKAVIAQLA